MENKIVLRYPYVRGLPDHAIYTSAIIDSRYLNNWIANHYIHITCNKNFVERGVSGFDFFIDYKKCPYLDINIIPGEIESTFKEDLWMKLCGIVNEGYIIQLFLRENLLENRQFTNMKDTIIHNNCLYGYDDNFAYLGFFDKRGKYDFGKLHKDIFMNALIVDKENPLIIAKQIENRRYKINLEYIVNSLIDFVKSFDLANKYDYPIGETASEQKAFGIEVYNYLSAYYLEMNKETLLKDIRPLFMLGEREKCMLYRLKSIENEFGIDLNEFKPVFTEYQEKMKLCSNLFIKYKINNDGRLLKHIADELIKIGISEKQSLLKLISVLARAVNTKERICSKG